MSRFFSQLPPVHSFLEFADPQHYTEPPVDDWVVLTDVENSTQKIREGNYKWVNLTGASTIVALVNALGTRDFPFVFGGDGAIAVIPGQLKAAAERYLRTVRANARKAFKLHVRVGLIPYRDLAQAGGRLEVARYQMTEGPAIAFFRGDGIEVAEQWIKSGKYLLSDGASEVPGKAMKGLSCRWAPLISRRGKMLSMIIRRNPKNRGDETALPRIAQDIDRIADLNSPDTHPVKASTFQPEKIWRAAQAETGLTAGRFKWFSQLQVALEMVLAAGLDRFDLKIPGLHFRKYKNSMIAHSDFRKYDEQLRLVIDCTSGMIESIRACLEKERTAGTIYYGLHESPAALLTCFLQSYDEGGHIHFVDGSDGGYAVAAQKLKAQIHNDIGMAPSDTKSVDSPL